MSRATRFSSALLLGLLLTAPPSWAAPATRAPDVLTRLWSLLNTLWADAGCIADPNGGCSPGLPQTDAGCIADPSGGCLPALPQPDAGCILDPSGGCSPQG